MLKGNIFITGGAGTLGRAIIAKAHSEHWDCAFTIFSTDAMKHSLVKRRWPKVRCVVGDIRDSLGLYNAMAGHDMIIHAAAVKHIPVSEYQACDTYAVNVTGSMNVFDLAMHLGVDVVAISTDKACGSHNAYGSTKFMMEKMAQEYARVANEIGHPSEYHLVRYGNVLESTGSVVEAWRNAEQAGQPIKITDPAMTRFYISPEQAVEYVVNAFKFNSGHIYIPKMKALSLATLADYIVGPDYPRELIPVRPGEKMHETLLTFHEIPYASAAYPDFFDLYPSTVGWPSPDNTPLVPYESDTAPELSKEELEELLAYDKS